MTPKRKDATWRRLRRVKTAASHTQSCRVKVSFNYCMSRCEEDKTSSIGVLVFARAVGSEFLSRTLEVDLRKCPSMTIFIFSFIRIDKTFILRGWGRKFEYEAKPRKAMTAYNFFIQENYRYLRRVLRDRDPHRVLREAAQRWKMLPKDKKKKFFDVSTKFRIFWIF